MAYIGRDTDKISNVEVLDNITFDGSSSYTLQKNSVNFTPSSANTLLISIDGVVQAGNFTVSNSTIDFGVAVAGTSTCDFILHYGVGLITTPADGTVTEAKIGSNAVTTAKIADDAVTENKLSALANPFASQLLHVRDEKAYNVHGGASISGIQTRVFNTVKTNEITGASLSSNQITLPAGTYYFTATAPNYRTDYSAILLYNVTDSSIILSSNTEYPYAPSSGLSTCNVSGRFTIASQKVLELRNYTQTAQSSHGLGLKVNESTLISVFADLQIWKVA